MMHTDWNGWRFAGREVVTPGRKRISADALEHLIEMHHLRLHWERVGLKAQATAAKEKRSAREARCLVRVVVVDLATYRRERGLSA